MKTRDRILQTSLELFNLEGEPNVTTVDIANELDISPGNLYYHFKGKEDIIGALYDRFHTELSDILNAPIAQLLKPDDAWFYLYIVFEETYKQRYFYRNLNDILQRYPVIEKRFRKLLEQKVAAAQAVARILIDRGVLALDEGQLSRLSEAVAMQVTFWLTYDLLRNNNPPEQLQIHQGVFQVMSLIAPYLTEGYRSFYDECCELYDSLTADLL
ncbi:AcrR family transcriptional regulator [Litorivivens lipolytica]|uniref:AcrR family transcriptional regulator n=1 Tax=Litorivivens lipolytica TaxID=1524264 RepID=A0A7W4Z5M6_9GAMM|nr:TetR/AcrR family transcriptional regulator [Litorivivens lipolytica]MBB3047267.1 AcrR family transcriptional regulator [Litorivivens lipolytica]